MTESLAAPSALDSARRKAYLRLIPLLFASYVIAYIDRVNIAFAKLTMAKDLPAFNDKVIGMGASLFFLGYFLLEIPGSVIVERWSARKWIARIMISWGIISTLTAWVSTPTQFYVARFLLGLAEAGFFPGVVIFLTHWFPQRDRARALALFLIATPVAQVLAPLGCKSLLEIGMTEAVNGQTVAHAAVMGLKGWQWVFVAWGIPAVVLGFMVLFFLIDWPREAKWLTAEEKAALEGEIERERLASAPKHKMGLLDGIKHPKVLLLALVYFCVVTANYGTEIFMPSFLDKWYSLKIDKIAALVILPPIGALAGQLFVGWNSDRTKERRLHTAVPIAVGALALALIPLSLGTLALTMALLIIGRTGIKAYQPAFWSLPTTFLTSTAAAGSVGFINSVGNLGGFVGPNVVGYVKEATGSYEGGIWFLATMMAIAVVVVFFLFSTKNEPKPEPVLTPGTTG
jgi:ACS family tartrate transporter-like MFS transporter